MFVSYFLENGKMKLGNTTAVHLLFSCLCGSCSRSLSLKMPPRFLRHQNVESVVCQTLVTLDK